MDVSSGDVREGAWVSEGCFVSSKFPLCLAKKFAEKGNLHDYGLIVHKVTPKKVSKLADGGALLPSASTRGVLLAPNIV